MTTTRKLLHLLCPIGKLLIIMHRLYSFYWFKLEALSETEVNAKKRIWYFLFKFPNPGHGRRSNRSNTCKRERRIWELRIDKENKSTIKMELLMWGGTLSQVICRLYRSGFSKVVTQNPRVLLGCLWRIKGAAWANFSRENLAIFQYSDVLRNKSK